MYCMKCGKKIDDDSNFCDGCGARVVPLEPEEPVNETPEAVAEAVTEAEPETKAETVEETAPEPESEPEAEAETEPEPESEPEAEAETEPVTETEPEAEAETEPVTEAQPEAEAEVTPEKAPEVVPEAVPEAVPETATETVSEASPNAKPENLLAKLISLLPKDKKKRTILGGISIVLVLVIIFSSAFGGGGKNEFVVETGIDDFYGGVAFDLEFGDFIERYNDIVEAESEYESVAALKKISYHDFKNNGVTDGIHQYIYSFGYTTGTFPFVQNHELASLLIGVNTQTDKIQIVKYVWQTDNYNTDDAMQYYYLELPAKIFSVFYSEIEYNHEGDYEDYKKLVDSLPKDGYDFSGNTMYGLFNTGTEKYMGFQMAAVTKDSEAYKSSK